MVIGGGLLGLEAARGLQSHGIAVDVVHSGKHLMNAQLGRDGGEVLRRSMAALGIGIFTGTRTTAIWGPDRVRGVRLRDETEIACDLVVVAAGIRPNTEVAVTSGFTVERAIVVDDFRCAPSTTTTCTRWASACSTAARSTAWSPRCGSRPWCWPTRSPAPTRPRPTTGSRTATKLKVAGVEVASMGLTEPERETDEHIVFSEPKRGVFKSVVIRDDKIVGATLLGDSSKVAFLQQAFDRGLPLPAERVELLFDLGGPPAEVGAAELADDAQVCNCNGVSKKTIVDCVGSRLQDRQRRDGQDPGRQGLRHLQGPGRPAGRVRRRRRRRGGPGRQLLRARASRWPRRR